MFYIDDTIAAIATAPGEAGIGIVRISGEKALAIADQIFISKQEKIKQLSCEKNDLWTYN